MQATEFADEIFRLWPKAFQPRDQWADEVVGAISEFGAAQLDGGLKTLKLKRAGRAIDLEAVTDACRNAVTIVALKSPFDGRRPPGADIPSFLAWLKRRGLRDAYRRATSNQQAMVLRLWAVLWGGSQCEAEADAIAGEGKSWELIERLYDHAMTIPECRSKDSGGWFAPWAERA